MGLLTLQRGVRASEGESDWHWKVRLNECIAQSWRQVLLEFVPHSLALVWSVPIDQVSNLHIFMCQPPSPRRTMMKAGARRGRRRVSVRVRSNLLLLRPRPFLVKIARKYRVWCQSVAGQIMKKCDP